MIRAEDVKAGYGQHRAKAPNPIIPYLKARQERWEQEIPKKRSIKAVKKAEEPEKVEDPENTLDDYDKARREILAEE